MPDAVLVTGGAGYIGSHTVLALAEAGLRPVVLDDLSTGRRDLLAPDVPLVLGSIGDRALVRRTIGEHAIGAVVHLAASAIVSHSVDDPLGYYRNNVANSIELIDACAGEGVRHFVFSSTCAVYGQPDRMPIDEEAEKRPVNPYGASKLMVERILQDAASRFAMACGVLRYFNVAGADPQGRTGESPPESHHLIKAACEAALGRRDALTIYGTDYPTPDGTCIRDYVHVSDIAEAHLRALRHLRAGGASFALNCGSGRGDSVREVVAAVEQIRGRPLPVREADRRPGDPAVLFAATGRIRDVLGWTPRHGLDAMIRSALSWEERLSAA